MNDAELSLAVAKIMWPKYEWVLDPDDSSQVKHKTNGGWWHIFSITTDDALGKMCVRLAVDDMAKDYLEDYLRRDHHHRRVAEAIVEANNG